MARTRPASISRPSYVTGIDTPANKAFLAAMSKKFGADLKTPNDLSVPEYEAVLCL